MISEGIHILLSLSSPFLTPLSSAAAMITSRIIDCAAMRLP